MKKLAGLLAFAVALACAILLTKYYSQPAPPPAQPAPAVVVQPASPAAPATGSNAPVVFKTQSVTLDLASKKASVTLTLERDRSRPAPERVWVWAYFFTQESPGRYCAGEPVEVKRPFDSDARTTVEMPVSGCPAPRTPSTTFYARVNVSSESAFAARLTEQRISYDTAQASPVVLQGAQPTKGAPKQ
jgi:hypothetical protein